MKLRVFGLTTVRDRHPASEIRDPVQHYLRAPVWVWRVDKFYDVNYDFLFERVWCFYLAHIRVERIMCGWRLDWRFHPVMFQREYRRTREQRLDNL